MITRKEKEMGCEKSLLSVDEFCQYVGIGKTKAREMLANPCCKYVVRIGRRVFVHKELLDEELKKSAKFSCERMRIMGKNLNGKELGKGLSQRPDGRYMGRAQVGGKSIVLYDWKLKELKKNLAKAVDEVKRSSLLPSMGM